MSIILTHHTVALSQNSLGTSEKFMCTLQNVWRHYKRCCEVVNTSTTSSTVQQAAYRTFCRYWIQLLPYIVVSKPRSDLCWVCHQNSSIMSKLSNKPDEEKMRVRNKYDQAYENQPWKCKLYFCLNLQI